MFHDSDHAERGEVGKHVYQHVVHQSRHTHCRAADDAQHDVSGLRYGGVSEETFQVLLP